jgi:glycosyltransferase involved in cell wall biosynthesis
MTLPKIPDNAVAERMLHCIGTSLSMSVSNVPDSVSTGPEVLLVDPSLFTPTYDRALSDGLAANGVHVSWAIRDTRAGEDEDDLSDYPEAMRFYPLSEGGRGPRGRLTKLLKGVEHWHGLRRLTKIARRFDVVHFQWTPLPLLDAAAMRRIRRTTPVVLTVHDVLPLNGADGVQVQGFRKLFDAADRLVVHTDRARRALTARGVPADRIEVIPHGPLALRCAPAVTETRPSGRWRIVLFGRLKPYKGVDLLIEALGRLETGQRERLEIVVAGEPSFPMEPLLARARELGLEEPTLRFVLKRLTDQEIADLLSNADCFVFPYRTIDASGVLYLVAGMGRWLIASPHGAFIDMLEDRPALGLLVDPEQVDALATALVDSIGRRPGHDGDVAIPSWDRIGRQTLDLYRGLIERRQASR